VRLPASLMEAMQALILDDKLKGALVNGLSMQLVGGGRCLRRLPVLPVPAPARPLARRRPARRPVLCVAGGLGWPGAGVAPAGTPASSHLAVPVRAMR
jgi:hypothetical protein